MSFHKYLWICRTNSSSVIPHLTYKKETIKTPEAKSDCFNEYFESVFTVDNGLRCSLDPPFDDSEPGKKLIISPEGILQLLKDLDANKTCGPDNLTGRMLKHFSPVIYLTLSEIFSYSLTTGTLPAIWKFTRVQPVYKKVSKHLPNSYWPISLTGITCKALEHVISSHVCNLLTTVSFFDDGQHGFWPHRSCKT